MRHPYLYILLLCCLLWPSCPVHAKKGEPSPEVKDIIVTTSDTDLLFFATVRNAFNQALREDIDRGVPIAFTFRLELAKSRSGWLDSSLVKTEITHTLSYNPDSREYTVVLSEQPNKKLCTPNPELAKQAMAELNGIRLIPLSRLAPDAPYSIRIKATLKQGNLPLGMARVLPFSSLWNFETDWRTIEFRY
ncbi:MAG: DUF4390 domain-containing protein [Desulfobulbus sp.]|jgi:hypothetical protein